MSNFINDKNLEPDIYSLTDFITKLTLLKNKFGTDDFFYRGQGNSKWEISSSAYRRLHRNNVNVTAKSMYSYISNLITETRKRDFERNFNDFDLVAEIQHRGGATNYIDFTKDAFIALYMACISTDNESCPVVYCINRDISEVTKLEFSNYVTFYSDILKDKTYYYYPALVNERIIKQSGLFLINQMGLIDKSLVNDILLVDSKSVNKILQELNEFANLNQETVYPDLQGFLNANNQFSALNLHSDYYEDALRDFTNEKYVLAIKKFNNCIENNINVTMCYKKIGICYSKLYNSKESILFLEEYVKVISNDAESYYYLGLQYYRNLDSSSKELSKHYVLNSNPIQSFQLAEMYFNKAVEINPQTAKYYITLGDLYYGDALFWDGYGIKTKLGIFKKEYLIKAREFYTKANALTNLRKGKLSTQLGIISLILDDKEDINQYKESIKWDKESKVTGFANLGAYFFDLYGRSNKESHLKQGIYFSKQAIFFDKFHFNAYKNIINALSNTNQYPLAIKLLVGFINDIPDSTSLIWRLFELIKKFDKNNLDDKSIFNKIKKLLPENYFIDCAWADRLLNMGNLDDAFDVLYSNSLQNENYLIRIIFAKYHFLKEEIDFALVNLQISASLISKSELRYAINVYLRRVSSISKQFKENNLEGEVESWLE